MKISISNTEQLTFEDQLLKDGVRGLSSSELENYYLREDFYRKLASDAINQKINQLEAEERRVIKIQSIKNQSRDFIIESFKAIALKQEPLFKKMNEISNRIYQIDESFKVEDFDTFLSKLAEEEKILRKIYSKLMKSNLKWNILEKELKLV